MTTIKNIARPCGDCWTNVAEETLSYKISCWADLQYLKTDKRIYERISGITMSISLIDNDKVLSLVLFILTCMSVGALMTIYGIYGVHTIDILAGFFRAILERLTSYTSGIEYTGDGSAWLYVIGLM